MQGSGPLPLDVLATSAISALPTRYGAQGCATVTRLIRLLEVACEAGGVDALPHPGFLKVARAFAQGPMPAQRLAAVRAVLRAALLEGVLVPDPYAKTYDRVAAGAGLPVALRIRTFRPAGLEPAAVERVRPFVEQAVTAALTHDPAIPYGLLANFLFRLAIWCDRAGIPLEARRVLDPRNVERYLLTRPELSGGSLSAARSVLGRTRQALAPSVQPRQIGRHRGAGPYSADEQRALVRWVRSFDPGELTAGLWPVVVFGLGAGFDVPPLRHLRGGDVGRLDGRVVAVAADERDVPVALMPEWAEEAEAIAAAAGYDFILRPGVGNRMSRNMVTGLLAAAGPPPPGVPRLHAQRLRATWLLAHLLRSTPLSVLVPMAGLATLGALDPYLAHLQWPGDAEALAALEPTP